MQRKYKIQHITAFKDFKKTEKTETVKKWIVWQQPANKLCKSM